MASGEAEKGNQVETSFFFKFLFYFYYRLLQPSVLGWMIGTSVINLVFEKS